MVGGRGRGRRRRRKKFGEQWGRGQKGARKREKREAEECCFEFVSELERGLLVREGEGGGGI